MNPLLLLGGLARALTSSTVWGGLLTLGAQIIASKHGVEVPPALLAAIPVAVGYKEAARRKADSELAQVEAHRAADVRIAEIEAAAKPANT